MSGAEIFSELGGGLSAVVIFCLGAACIKLYRDLRKLEADRFADAQENAKAHAATIKEVVEGLTGATVAINATTDTIRELRAEVRDLGR